jgi:outer membrane lipoprotein-sorting protein
LRSIAWGLASICCLRAQDSEAVLKLVDGYRYPWPRFSTEVALKDGKTDQRWQVLVRENGDARVDGLSEKEKGRTVLLLGDQMWLLLPGSKRPIKVSPQQRLLGPAAGGDLARFRFSGDYSVVGDREETLEGKPCRRLELQAKQASASYRTALLWTTRDAIPLRCHFFFASGKLARTAWFGAIVSAHGERVLSTLRLEDPAGRGVELVFSRWQPVASENQLFELPKAAPKVSDP